MKKTLAIDFDTDTSEDRIVFDYLTQNLPPQLVGTEFSVSNVAVGMIYETLKTLKPCRR